MRPHFCEETALFRELFRDVDEAQRRCRTALDWSLSNCFAMLDGGDRWAAQIVRDRLDEAPRFPQRRGGKPPPDRADAISWLHGGAQRLVDAVELSGVETPVWTFLGTASGELVDPAPATSGGAPADVAIAVGTEFTLAPDVASDVITELLERIVIQAGRGGDPLPLEEGNTIRICTLPIRD